MRSEATFNELILHAGQSFGARNFLTDESPIGTVSYAELLRFSTGLGRRLDALQIPRGAAVATIFHNCGLAVLSFLAVLANGRILVPLNPMSSKEELDYMLDRAACEAVFLDPTHARSNDFGGRIVERILDHRRYYEQISALSVGSGSAALAADRSVPFVGEVVFTSGSTGRPKGVVLSEANLLANARALADAYQITREDRFLTVCPLFHNSGQVFTTLSCILAGASTTVVKSDVGMLRFWHYVDKYRAQWSLGMVSFLALLLSRAEDPSKTTSMRGLLTGGSAIDAGLVRQFEERFGIPVRTVYGLTESSSIATCEFADPSPRSLGSSGRPLPKCDVRIGSDVEHLATPGEPSSRKPGEIWIAGPTIFDRYIADPALTEIRKRGGWLQTGDLGYFDENGNLFVIDRLDSMLIVGGENVYPAEIEKYCTLLPGAAQVVLTGIDDPIWGKKLVLVYVAERNANPSPKEWHKILVEKVTTFKLPQAYVSVQELGVDELPRKENGKLDRPALLSLVRSRYSATAKETVR